MAKCFIHGSTLIDRNGKSACLKIYRDQDQKELSICFDNSCSALDDECRRIEACLFANKNSNKPEQTFYISNSLQLAGVITSFVTDVI